MYAGRVAEVGDVDTIFYRPRHGYTFGLLSSLPRLDGRGQPSPATDPRATAEPHPTCPRLRVPSPLSLRPRRVCDTRARARSTDEPEPSTRRVIRAERVALALPTEVMSDDDALLRGQVSRQALPGAIAASCCDGTSAPSKRSMASASWSRAARRWRSSASRAVASRRWPDQSCGWTNRPRAACASTARTSRTRTVHEMRRLRREMQIVFQDPYRQPRSAHDRRAILTEPFADARLARRRDAFNRVCSTSSACRPSMRPAIRTSSPAGNASESASRARLPSSPS